MKTINIEGIAVTTVEVNGMLAISRKNQLEEVAKRNKTSYEVVLRASDAFWGVNEDDEQLLLKEFPNGCDMKDAILCFKNLSNTKNDEFEATDFGKVESK